MPARASLRLLALIALGLPSAAAFADACGGSRSNPVIEENCNTPQSSWSSAWKINRVSYVYDPAVLAGYAGASSAAPGETLNLYIQLKASSPDYQMQVFRLGWYGGAGGRLMQTASSLKAPSQPACEWQLPGTLGEYYTCNNWRLSYQLTIPADWVSGVYLAVLTSTALAGAPNPALPYQAHIVFVVRDDRRTAELYYQQAIATDQAYNNRFGPGIYIETTYRGHTVPIVKASFDRPYDVLDNTQFYRYEYPFVSWLESEGYDVVYGTDLDTHLGRLSAARFKGLLTSGHSEYWSKVMYDTFTAARDRGVNLGFFSGDTIYWQMRIEDDLSNPGDGSHDPHDRVMTVWRHAYPPQSNGLGDPNPDPSLQTALWRAFPVLRDEQALVGVHFTHSQSCPEHTAAWASSAGVPTAKLPQSAPYLIAAPQPLIVADASNWVFAGTGLTRGAMVAYAYGQETDAFQTRKSVGACAGSWSEPPPVVPAHRAGSLSVLSDSPFNHVVAPLGQPVIYQPTHVNVNSVIYQACSGAWVFGAGSIMWANTLAPTNMLGTNYTSAAMLTINRNLLDALSARRPPPDAGGVCTPQSPPAVNAVADTVLTD